MLFSTHHTKEKKEEKTIHERTRIHTKELWAFLIRVPFVFVRGFCPTGMHVWKAGLTCQRHFSMVLWRAERTIEDRESKIENRKTEPTAPSSILNPQSAIPLVGGARKRGWEQSIMLVGPALGPFHIDKE